MCMNMLSCCLNPACEVSAVGFISRILSVPVQCVRSQKNTNESPESSEDKCGFYLTFQQTVLSIWSLRSFQPTWCQITLQPELSASLCFWARYEHVIRFLRAERLRRLRPDSKMDVWCPFTSPGPHPNGFLLRSRAPAQTDWKRLGVSLG